MFRATSTTDYAAAHAFLLLFSQMVHLCAHKWRWCLYPYVETSAVSVQCWYFSQCSGQATKHVTCVLVCDQAWRSVETWGHYNGVWRQKLMWVGTQYVWMPKTGLYIWYTTYVKLHKLMAYFSIRGFVYFAFSLYQNFFELIIKTILLARGPDWHGRHTYLVGWSTKLMRWYVWTDLTCESWFAPPLTSSNSGVAPLWLGLTQ